MKKATILILALQLMVIASYAQSKKELEKSLKTALAEKDSLQKENANLTSSYDSLLRSQNTADSLNKIAMEEAKAKEDSVAKIPKDDFLASATDSSTKSGKTISDSANTTKPGVTSGENSTSSTFVDSLKNENEHLKYLINKNFGTGTIPLKPEEFTGLWALSLQYFKVTDDSTKSGLINIPAPAGSRVAVRVIFIDYELAEITFNNGETSKCFYKINSFSTNKPYSIDFTKGTDINSRLQVNPVLGSELQVSYKRGDGYYSGFMRKL